VIQCLIASAVTSLGLPAKLFRAWQRASQRLDQRDKTSGAAGAIPPRLFVVGLFERPALLLTQRGRSNSGGRRRHSGGGVAQSEAANALTIRAGFDERSVDSSGDRTHRGRDDIELLTIIENLDQQNDHGEQRHEPVELVISPVRLVTQGRKMLRCRPRDDQIAQSNSSEQMPHGN
jgi:hypothetical protein